MNNINFYYYYVESHDSDINAILVVNIFISNVFTKDVIITCTIINYKSIFCYFARLLFI